MCVCVRENEREGGKLISIEDEADCTECYLNQGEQTEAVNKFKWRRKTES